MNHSLSFIGYKKNPGRYFILIFLGCCFLLLPTAASNNLAILFSFLSSLILLNRYSLVMPLK